MKKVLVIDDEAPFREAVAFALEGEGYKVIQADSAAEGINLARTQKPDLILSDVVMESVDGYETLVSLRQDPRTVEIPIILMTGRANKEGLVHAIELGADDYLSKPFSMPELLEAVSIRFKKQEDLRQKQREILSDPRSHLTIGIPTDLRTPIAGILGFSKALSREYVEMKQSEIQELGRAIQKAARNLLRLTENFSILSQIEIIGTDAAKIQGLRSFKTMVTKEFLEPIALDLAHQYERDSDLVTIIGEVSTACSSEYVAKMVHELIDNAMKFSSKGQKIQVSALPENGTMAFIVTDFGRGMTPQQISDVNSFLSLHARLHEERYIGWGLVVTKRLAEIHGGSLTLASAGAAGMMAKILLPSPR